MTIGAVTALAHAHALMIAMTVATVGRTGQALRIPTTATASMIAAIATLESESANVTTLLAGAGVRHRTLTPNRLVPGPSPHPGTVIVVSVMEKSVAVGPPHRAPARGAKVLSELLEVSPPVGTRSAS